MTFAAAIILFSNAAFNVIAWPRFFERVLHDPRNRDAAGGSTVFLKVHAVHLVIALFLTLAPAVSGAILPVGSCRASESR